MTLLMLNRHRVLTQLPKWIPDSGRRLVVLTARPATAGLAPHWLDRNFRRVEIVDDYDSPMIDHTIDALCEQENITRLLTTAELDIIRAARARERNQLPGQSLTQALAYRDKYEMKLLARAAGISVPEMQLVCNQAELSSFAESYGVPVVIKPRYGRNSVGVMILHETDIRGFCFTEGERLAERYIRGIVYHVDGLMSHGRVLHSWPSRKLYPALDTVTSAVPSISGMLPMSDPLFQRLQHETSAVIGALPAIENVSAFHVEFFRTSNDELMLCEIACRTGGCGIVEVYELAFGINLYAAHLRGQAGEINDISADGSGDRYGWAWYPPQRGILRAMPGSCSLPGVRRFTPYGVIGEWYPGPQSSTDRVAELVFQLAPAQDMLEQLKEADDWWGREAQWSEIELRPG